MQCRAGDRAAGEPAIRTAVGKRLGDTDRAGRGDAGLYEPRTGRRSARCAGAGQRRLQPGSDALRDADRSTAVSGRV